MGMLFLPFMIVIATAVLVGLIFLLISFSSMFSKREDNVTASKINLKLAGVSFAIAIITFLLLNGFINSIY